MTRMRYFELPMEHDGEDVTTPFIIVFDRITSDPQTYANHFEPIKAFTGAKAVLAFAEEVDFE